MTSADFQSWGCVTLVGAAEWFSVVLLRATLSLVTVLTARVGVVCVTRGVKSTSIVGEVLSTDMVAVLPVPVVAMRHFVADMVLVVTVLSLIGVVVWLMAAGGLTWLLVEGQMAGASVTAVGFVAGGIEVQGIVAVRWMLASVVVRVVRGAVFLLVAVKTTPLVFAPVLSQ